MRRVFLTRAEVPGLLRGVLTGDATALRRILGARRGGRYGASLAALAAVAAVPPAALVALVVAHLGLSVAGHFAVRAADLGPRQYQRLVMWALAVPLLGSAPLRLVELGGLGLLPAILAIAVGHGLLWSGLRRGIDQRRLA